MKRYRKEKYYSDHADEYFLGVPVDKGYADKQGHYNAGYYGFNIDIQNIKRQNVKKSVKAFNDRIAGRYLCTAAVTFSSQHYPAENGYQIDRSDFCTAGHAVRSLFLIFFCLPYSENGWAVWIGKSVNYNIEEASDTYPKQKNYDVKHDLEWQLGKFIVEHIFKSEHDFTPPSYLKCT